MLQYLMKIYFIFVLSMIFENKFCISQENGTKETDISSTRTERCESKFCSCAGFSKIDGVYCSDENESGLLYMKFHRSKHLRTRQLIGSRIKLLVLSNANISVDEDFLEGTKALLEFEVIESCIQIIPDFRIVKDSIQRIKIDSSRLTSLKGKNLQNLTSVTHLSFSNNSIECIDPNVFKGTENVKELDLSYNLLSFIPPGLLNRMKNLEVFSASHNNLLHIDHLFSSTVPKINERILACDGVPPAVDENSYPSNINDSVLGNNLTNNNLESLDDAQLPLSLNQLYLSVNKLRELPVLDSRLNLKIVSLSGNPWKCDCSAIKSFKTWLTSTINIKDIHDIRCGISEENERSNLNGRVILELADGFDLCPETERFIVEHPTYYIVAFVVLAFVIFCLAAKILYTKFEFNVKLFLYGYGSIFFKDEDTDYDKQFDAFVCFSHEDEDFAVNEIILGMENQRPTIKLCLHFRDFLPGEYISNNIARAVQNSKSTVFILSRNFLASEWCLLEFKIAHQQALLDKRHRIIVVKVGVLPEEIDPTIKVYLDSTKCLTWAERHFWEKMLFILP